MRDRLKFNFWLFICAINFVNILVPTQHTETEWFTFTASIWGMFFAGYMAYKIAFKQ